MGGTIAELARSRDSVGLIVSGRCEWQAYALQRELQLGLWEVHPPGSSAAITALRMTGEGYGGIPIDGQVFCKSEAADLSLVDMKIADKLAGIGIITRQAWR